ncbi:MAG: hydroxymethylglutaryl-CoA synthase family protein [Candidatus Heimdallarchaeota archaeon]|nr:hydroxymethylglutaryl-CoA synthase family protein [Candidatus Heimdallarchaeota archaeon]
MNTTNIPIRGTIRTMANYLGSAQITAEEFVKYKPQVPLGLLKALGLNANTVPLPTEDPTTMLMNAVQEIIKEELSYSYIEVGTESLNDGSLPISQYALQFLPHDDVFSNESKHACIGAMNAIWRNVADDGLVIATDIAEYADDEHTAASAEFTGGAGAIAVATGGEKAVLEILNVRGASASLVHDFYKPYIRDGTTLTGNSYPVVFGAYSNLANYERVGRAYEKLKEKTGITLDEVAGVVMHAPYPGICKYNLAYLCLIDRPSSNLLYIRNLTEKAHIHFKDKEFNSIAPIEKQVKQMLKEVMETSNFKNQYEKLKPSLEFISRTGNLYTGSSPLCMMSLLENKEFKEGELILWGGYGSGNQALFMMARTTEETNKIASEWKTAEKLDNRRVLTAEEYKQYKDIGFVSHEDLAFADCCELPDGYYLHSVNEYQIREYKPSMSETISVEYKLSI